MAEQSSGWQEMQQGLPKEFLAHHSVIKMT